MKKLLAITFAATPFFTTAQTENSGGPISRWLEDRPIDRHAEVFKTKEKTPILFKWNALKLLPSEDITEWEFKNEVYDGKNPLQIGLEWKLLPAFSFNYALGGTWSKLLDDNNPFIYWRTEQHFEPRWYFEMPRRSRAGKQADNLSGNYLSLEYSNQRATYRLNAKPGSDEDEISRQHLFLARIGAQRRFFREGWFDISLGLGAKKSKTTGGFVSADEKETAAHFDFRLGGGLALGDFSKKPTPKTARNKVFFGDEEIYLLQKLDLYGLIRRHESGFHGKVSLAWEMKLGRAPLSVELEMLVPYSRTRIELGSGQFSGKSFIGGGGGLEPRLFLFQKNRQNLNGLFVGWNGTAVWKSDRGREFRSTPVVGLQSRFFEWGFIAYKVGYGKSWVHTCNEDFWNIVCGTEVFRHLLSEFKVGLSF